MVTSLFKELRKEDVNLQTKEVPKKKKGYVTIGLKSLLNPQ